MATFPWIESFAKMNPHWFSNHKAVNAWIEKISKRPACTKIFM
jgi:glutathione S-transferase